MSQKYIWTKENILRVKAMWEGSSTNEIARKIGTSPLEVQKIVQILRANKIALPKKNNAGENTKTVRELIAQGLI